MNYRILEGDAMKVLRTLATESVQCVVTSPPYWGLRDYGTAQWKGGDPECKHRVSGQVPDSKATAAITTGQRFGADATRCKECGARRADRQLGLETTPKKYVARMVKIFREVRRVLRKDGTLWLNMGDSYYNGDKGGYERSTTGKQNTVRGTVKGLTANRLWQKQLKPKDMVGIPWMLAFALRADGWWLRQDLIWSKPNPMPESVTDRCTKAHEYLFLLTKSARYFYDQEAIKEPPAEYGHGEGGNQSFGVIGGKAQIAYGQLVSGQKRWDNPGKWSGQDPQSAARRMTENVHAARAAGGAHDNPFSGSRAAPASWDMTTGDGRHGTVHHAGRASGNKTHKTVAEYERAQAELAELGKRSTLGGRAALTPLPSAHRTAAGLLQIAETAYGTRNKRSVWEIATQPFPEAHFATFPEKLAEPCILAGTSEYGCCAQCGAPWGRIAQSSEVPDEVYTRTRNPGDELVGRTSRKGGNGQLYQNWKRDNPTKTLGWQPTCRCVAPSPLIPSPCMVLDPFCGAGTSGVVALRYGRNFIGIELSPAYAAMARRRIEQDAPLFNKDSGVSAVSGVRDEQAELFAGEV